MTTKKAMRWCREHDCLVEFLPTDLVQVCTPDGLLVQSKTFVKAVLKISKRVAKRAAGKK